MKKDYVEVLGVKVFGFHGVFEEEKTKGQEFVVDVRLYLSLRTAGQSDDVQDTVNYAEIVKLIEERVQSPSVNLIETLAEQIANACLGFEIVDKVRVKVHKPHAPLSASFDDVAVCIYRDRV